MEDGAVGKDQARSRERGEGVEAWTTQLMNLGRLCHGMTWVNETHDDIIEDTSRWMWWVKHFRFEDRVAVLPPTKRQNGYQNLN